MAIRTLTQKLQRILSDTLKKGSDPGKRLDVLKHDHPDLYERLVNSVGAPPGLDIALVPDSVAIPYSARDADSTLRLYPSLEPKIQALGLERILALDMAVVPMIERMQSVGFKINRPYLKGLGTVLTLQMNDRRERIRKLTGRPEFNPGSGDQVAEYLFNILKLAPVKMTKSGARPAVDDKVLEELLIRDVDNELAVEFINLKGDYTEAEKLKGTYTDNIDRFADKEDRVHTHIRITRVVSGRLATFDPNLLAIPVRSKLGRMIRGGFVASPGKILASFDLDQIEMRVMAHESEDPMLIAVLSDQKRHIHKETVHKTYGIPVEKVDKESIEYMMAKNLSFGILFLISAKGLRAQMAQRGQWRTEDECQQMIDDWYKIYPGVRVYQERTRAEAARYGYVRTMLGRIRYLPGVRSTLPYIRSEAERAAGNHGIQGGATDIMKLWMVKAWEKMKSGIAEPLLTVHDEQIWELDEDKRDLVEFLVKESLKEAIEPLHLRVPIRCGVNFGHSWADLKG